MRQVFIGGFGFEREESVDGFDAGNGKLTDTEAGRKGFGYHFGQDA